MVGKSPPALPTQKSLLEICPCPCWKFIAPVTQFLREYMALLQLSLGLFAPPNNQTDKLPWRLKSSVCLKCYCCLKGDTLDVGLNRAQRGRYLAVCTLKDKVRSVSVHKEQWAALAERLQELLSGIPVCAGIPELTKWKMWSVAPNSLAKQCW